MDRAVILLVSGASATLHVPFVLHSFACIFLHFPFICMHFPFIVHSVPFMFLSSVFMSIHFPFIFLSFSFQCVFMSSHLPFICTHVPFILHSYPFMSFLKLWNGSMAWPNNRAQQLAISKLSLRLLLNNPSNI